MIIIFNLQLKERISTGEDGHEAEVDGMKEQIANMTAEIHKRYFCLSWLFVYLFVCVCIFVC